MFEIPRTSSKCYFPLSLLLEISLKAPALPESPRGKQGPSRYGEDVPLLPRLPNRWAFTTVTQDHAALRDL